MFPVGMFIISHIVSTTSTPSVTLYSNLVIRNYHPKFINAENKLKEVNILPKVIQLVNMGIRI